MSDAELKLAELRAEADQELAADGAWADITLPAWLFLEILDRAEGHHHRGNNSAQTPLRT